MHERRRCGLLAAAAARFSSEPDMEKLTTPADVNVSHSRRDRVGMRVMLDAPIGSWGHDANRAGLVSARLASCPTRWSMIQDEFAAIKDRPEDIGEGVVLDRRPAALIGSVGHNVLDRAGEING